MAKMRVTVTYRDKKGNEKTKTKTCKDKAQVALFVNKYLGKGNFMGFTQVEVK